MKQYKLITKSSDETRAFGEYIGKHLTAGTLILLEGDLGAGKTTFSSGVGLGLGVKRRVNSPTYTIMKQYTGRLQLHHIDAYRISEDDSEYLGMEEALYGDGVCLVEWYRNIAELLSEQYIKIKIETVNEFEREVLIETVGEKYEQFGSEVIGNYINNRSIGG